MSGCRNLSQTEAIERARLLDVGGYEIVLDLSGEGTFRSTTTIRFDCAEPGASTFIEAAAESIRAATLNGQPLSAAGWSAETGLRVPGLAAHNVLVVDADFAYSSSGQGMHRLTDPVDQRVYLYSQFETADAQRVFACFDQPDLKSVYVWTVHVPADWTAISNARIVREEPGGPGRKTIHFEQSARMSTYVTALCAGPYHQIQDHHDGIDLGIYARQSMVAHVDADDIFLITEQGLDFYNRHFGTRYPLPKYDQVFTPEFNAGAMENFGCVVHSEDHYIFRSQVTEVEYEQRAGTILHEMAHMWFGDLVTLRWWDDLWLNESFAEWASHWCAAEATRFTDAWTTFLSLRKAWGYRQDQLSSTHPVYCEMPDVAAVEMNFDGITYAKGASVIKQLVAYVGIDVFLAGLRDYFARNAWSNATFDDLLSCLENACGKELRKFAAQWLETAQVNTLRPIVELDPAGRYSSVVVEQDAPEGYPTLRTHRIGIGLYDLDGSRMVRRELIETDVSGPRTQVAELAGRARADLLLLNDEDLSYTKLRLDDASMACVVAHISGLSSPLARALCWGAAWDMVRDAELATRDFLRLVVGGLPTERDPNLVYTTLTSAQSALLLYADPQYAPAGLAVLAKTALEVVARRPEGAGLQLSWARAYVGAARTPDELAVLRRWLDGTDIPAGLTVDTELRWRLVQALATAASAGEPEIEAELERDRTAGGQREALMARARIATPEAKADAWRQLTAETPPPNWQQRSLLSGFTHSSQLSLTRAYVQPYFAVVDRIWASRDSDPAQEFVRLLYPVYLVDDEVLTMTDAWLAEPHHPATLRRLIAEGRDGIVRALRARAKDRAAGLASTAAGPTRT